MRKHYYRSFIAASGTALAIGACPGVLAAYGEPDMVQSLNDAYRSHAEALLAVAREQPPLVTTASQSDPPRGPVSTYTDDDHDGSLQPASDVVAAADGAVVNSTDTAAPDGGTESTYGEILDDAAISTAVNAKLLWSSQVDALSVRVSTEAGQVTLQGEVESDGERSAAERLATGVAGVSSVRNELVVTAQPDAGSTLPVSTSFIDSLKVSTRGVGRGVSDAWITTRVKSALMYSYGIRGGSVSVSTQEGLVTLVGSVDSEDEHARLVDRVRNIRGVARVNATRLTSPSD